MGNKYANITVRVGKPVEAEQMGKIHALIDDGWEVHSVIPVEQDATYPVLVYVMVWR